MCTVNNVTMLNIHFIIHTVAVGCSESIIGPPQTIVTVKDQPVRFRCLFQAPSLDFFTLISYWEVFLPSNETILIYGNKSDPHFKIIFYQSRCPPNTDNCCKNLTSILVFNASLEYNGMVVGCIVKLTKTHIVWEKNGSLGEQNVIVFYVSTTHVFIFF